TDDHARMRPAVLVDLLDEVAEHLLRDVEVRDHAVLQRPDRLDRPGGAPKHALGLDSNRVNLARARVDRDDRRLRQDDSAPAHVDERVGGPEVDRHVAAPEPREIAEKPHKKRPQGAETAAEAWKSLASGLAPGEAAILRPPYGCRRSGARASRFGTGRPTTFQKSPSIWATSADPRPWIA